MRRKAYSSIDKGRNVVVRARHLRHVVTHQDLHGVHLIPAVSTVADLTSGVVATGPEVSRCRQQVTGLPAGSNRGQGFRLCDFGRGRVVVGGSGLVITQLPLLVVSPAELDVAHSWVRHQRHGLPIGFSATTLGHRLHRRI